MKIESIYGHFNYKITKLKITKATKFKEKKCVVCHFTYHHSYDKKLRKVPGLHTIAESLVSSQWLLCIYTVNEMAKLCWQYYFCLKKAKSYFFSLYAVLKFLLPGQFLTSFAFDSVWTLDVKSYHIAGVNIWTRIEHKLATLEIVTSPSI